jgi:DNA-binding CsgD family transcriptional regulator
MGSRNGAGEQLIDEIYDAGARPDRWPATLSHLASAVGAEGAVMFGFSRSRGLMLEHNGSLDPSSAANFKARHLNNAWVQGMAQRPTDHLVLSEELIRLRELRRSAFFDEVLRPGGLGHAALSTLTAGPDITIQFSVHKRLTTGSFKSAETLDLRRWLPHLRRALGVSLRLRPASGSDIDPVANRLVCAAFTLNRDGALIEVNLQAQHLAVRCGSFALSRDGIRFRHPDTHRKLLQAIKLVLAGAPLQPLLLTDGEHRFDVMIAGLKGRNTHWLNPPCRQAAAVLILIDLQRHPAVSEALQCAHQQLTAAELRVARIAALGVSSLEVSRTLELSLNTVKTHLRRVYQKLDIHRQGELVALLGSWRPDEESD